MSSFIKQYFCNHNWEEKYRAQIYENASDTYPSKMRITLICSKCGKIKQILI